MAIDERERKEILDELGKAVIRFDKKAARASAERALKVGISPIDALELGLGKGLREVGDKFECGDSFLPELIMASEAMKAGFEVLKAELSKSDASKKSSGKLIIGTVEGDIHDIGKQIVATLLFISGFEVIDLGVDVSPQKFIKAVKDEKASIIGLSSLMTTTLPGQKRVIEALDEHLLREKVKVLIGGAATSQSWANEIGADGWAPNGVLAVKEAKRLMAML